jgi:hypothetical protein
MKVFSCVTDLSQNSKKCLIFLSKIKRNDKNLYLCKVPNNDIIYAKSINSDFDYFYV